MFMRTVNIKGVQLFPFQSREQIVDYLSKNPGILVAINAEKILHANEQTRNIINRNIGYCDGAGPLMLLHKMGFTKAIKVAGCELWLDIVRQLHKDKTFYLVGGKQEVIDETVAKLKKEYGGIRIVGYRNGYIKSEEEKQALITDIATKKPDVVFVAMGSPRQELLMEEMMAQHKCIYQGLGGSFDVYTGHVKRATKWWVDHNLEWAYRLVYQPARIKRQIHLVKFAWMILMANFTFSFGAAGNQLSIPTAIS